MPIKLVIESSAGASSADRWERCFDQETVTIGRASTNDLNLEDPRRVVSSRHAEIRRTEQECLLVDVGSTNGTLVNDRRLAPAQACRLQTGDRIHIGDFVIHVDLLPIPAGAIAAPQIRATPTAVVDQRDRGPELIYDLARKYADVNRKRTDERSSFLLSRLREATHGLVLTDIEELLGEVERAFPVGHAAGPSVASAPGFDAHAPRSAQEHAVAIARAYCKDLDPPVSPEYVDKLMRRIGRVLDVMITKLLDAVQGRRQFELEFEVEATRILAWTPNRIKLAEDAQEIGAYLLDPRQGDTEADRAAQDLDGVFCDLALHQVGLVAGFRECVRGLLSQLDPASLEEEVRNDSSRLGPLKLWRSISYVSESAAWRRFKSRHRQLSEEEVKVFEYILAPYFAKGYLSVQKAKSLR